MSTPIDISEENGVRYLHFGSEWVQGAMRIRRPYALELAYTREMMAPLLLTPANDWPRRILTIGIGAGSICKFIHRNLPEARLTAVEIDAKVVAVAEQFFKLPPDDARFEIVVADGVHYLLDTDRRFDLILVDGFDQHARAGALDTLPFYQTCWARLSERGLLATNLFGRSRGFKASVERLKEAFDGHAVAFPSCDSGNVVALAARSETAPTDATEMRARAYALKEKSGLDLRPTVSRLEEAGLFAGGAFRI
ncbi:MAG: fused MFS/spermidine synthase [Rhodocyclaceae bacterium]|nr:fused MFS/spermidine synthase [Rhodocyclaceae bacterium]